MAKHCRTCLHWAKIDTYGLCALLSPGDSRDTLAVARVTKLQGEEDGCRVWDFVEEPNYAGSLVTWPEFGCVQHEKKEKA